MTQNEQSYTINGKGFIDFYIRYEHFNDCIAHPELQKPELSGLGEAFRSTNAKSGIRPKDRGTDEYFDHNNELEETVPFLQGHHIKRFEYSLPQRRRE